MSVFELFAAGGFALFGLLLAVLAIGLLAGAALGYFTASTDLRQERANAWERGFRDLRAAVESVWLPPTTLLAKVRNPYLKRSLAPEPPVFAWPAEPQHPESLRGVLFDQDAPTAAARAIELRGDD